MSLFYIFHDQVSPIVTLKSYPYAIDARPGTIYYNTFTKEWRQVTIIFKPDNNQDGYFMNNVLKEPPNWVKTYCLLLGLNI